MTLDLAAYFNRIGYGGPRVPTIEVLNALTAAHTQAIPFENLDVLLGRGIDLAPDAVFDKLVRRRRGGYCFEHNGLFLEVLTALGFAVRPLSARGRILPPRGQIPPRTHMLLEVQIGGERWLTDVGVGALSLTSAIRFAIDEEQRSAQETPKQLHDDLRTLGLRERRGQDGEQPIRHTRNWPGRRLGHRYRGFSGPRQAFTHETA
jgi:N-hydroxyarylamine O-acetyltransferase